MKSIRLIVLLLLQLSCETSTAAALFNQEVKLTASDGSNRDLFGYSVAISGNTAIIGSPYNKERFYPYTQYGSAYLFDVTTGSELLKLTPDTVGTFGISVAIDGNVAIVGADHDWREFVSYGAAYLFDVTTGEELFKLTASDAAADDRFGRSVAISGNTAIIGAFQNDDSDRDSGSAYVFDVTTGEELFKLTAPDSSREQYFGYSVAISGNTAIVGAYRDHGNVSSSGAAYVFDVATGEQLLKLTASDGNGSDYFGYAVAINGNTAIVGAKGHDTEAGSASGAAYLFDVTTGEEILKLTAGDGDKGDFFGESVAISGNTAIVGAYGETSVAFQSGAAYMFDVTSGKQTAKLVADDLARTDWFGKSVGISGNKAIVGTPNKNEVGDRYGTAYLFVPEPACIFLCAIAAICSVTRTPLLAITDK